MTREQRFAAVFVELADTLVDDFDIIEFLQTLADRCVELLDIAAAGLVLATRRDELHPVAASDERTRMLELFELQSDEGPCRDCLRTGEAVSGVVLASARDRWPRFVPAALAAGFGAADAVPLRLRRDVVGALNLFHHGTTGLAPDQLPLAQALADVATIGILQQRSIARGEILAGQLQLALSTRVVIEQAKGILAERWRIGVDDAFVMLRARARSHNRRLSVLAREVIDGTTDTATWEPPQVALPPHADL